MRKKKSYTEIPSKGFPFRDLVIGNLYVTIDKHGRGELWFKSQVLMCVDIKNTLVPEAKKGYFIADFHNITDNKYEKYIADYTHSGYISVKPYVLEEETPPPARREMK